MNETTAPQINRPGPKGSFERSCLECTKRFTGCHPEVRFCCQACRKAYNNRRMTLGAEVFDAAMQARWSRDPEAFNYLYWLLDGMIREWKAEGRTMPRARQRVKAKVVAYNVAGNRRK